MIRKTNRIMTAEEIRLENENLLIRRGMETKRNQCPQQIAPVIPTSASDEGANVNDAIQAYFNAIRNDEPTGAPKEVINSSRELWDAFDDEEHPKLADACRTIAKWYNERMPVGGALILNGGYGCGKTHLARAIAQMYGFYAVFVEEEDLFCSIKDSYDSHSESEYRILGRLERAKLLVFDDLGAYNTNSMPWVQNIYRGVFNDRVQCGLPFIITTNLSFKANGGPSEFEERVGGRNYSRIMGAVGSAEYYINLFSVPDYRLKGFRK